MSQTSIYFKTNENEKCAIFFHFYGKCSWIPFFYVMLCVQTKKICFQKCV